MSDSAAGGHPGGRHLLGEYQAARQRRAPKDDPPEGDLGDRVDRLETGQTSILAKLDQLIGGGSKTADPPAGPAGRPGTVEEQVQAELKRRDDEAAAKAKDAADKADRETIKERLAKLAETPPVQPQPRRQRVMWGKNT